MIPKLFAFDMDGTLLDSSKRIRAANINALREIKASGAIIALASGRVGFSVRRYVPDLGFDPALVILNGGEVYTSSSPDAPCIYCAPLDAAYAGYITGYVKDKPVAVNFYLNDQIYSVQTSHNMEWIELYRRLVGVERVFVDDFSSMNGISPSKIIFIGNSDYLDELEAHFRAIWADGSVYVCRSFKNYLEFMDPGATKGIGLKVLCDAMGVDMSETAAYGDEENDVPMLETAGMGVAMKNAPERIRKLAKWVTEMTNEEDWIAREWERMNAQRQY